jgi:hypothetical protein
MVMKFTNNAVSTLAAGITNTATSMSVLAGTGLLFPVLGAGDYFYCTLATIGGVVEIIKVTARSVDTFTITRGVDNTSAVSWITGDKVELRLVAAVLNDLPKLDEDNAFTSTGSLKVPVGTAAQRPVAGAGKLRFNSDSGSFEGNNGAAWTAISSLSSKLINGGFPINQLALTGTVALAAGAYGHDMWKAGAGGCTYTFSTVQNVTTVTISAGTLMQVIEGLNLQSGQHYLTWTGTATGRVDSGAYGASGVVGTAIGGTNQTVEFGVGTLSLVGYTQSAISSFEFRPIGVELPLCQRYYQKTYDLGVAPGSATQIGAITVFSLQSNRPYINSKFPVVMRATPTITIYNPTTGAIGTADTGISISQDTFSTNGICYYAFGTTGTAGALFHYTASARL